MKLAHLHEARYHGEHPVVSWLFDNNRTTTYVTYPGDEFEAIVQELSNIFGQPEIEPDFDDDPDLDPRDEDHWYYWDTSSGAIQLCYSPHDNGHTVSITTPSP